MTTLIIPTEYLYMFIWLLIWIIIWFILGIHIKQSIKIEKLLWFIVLVIRLTLTIYGFFNSKDIPALFDFAWFTALWLLLWIKVSEDITQSIIDKFKWWK